MEFNIQKCATFTITGKRKPSTHSMSYSMMPYLKWTNTSTWRSTCPKIFDGLPIARRYSTRQTKPLGYYKGPSPRVRKRLKPWSYQALVRPQHEYGSEAYNPCHTSVVQRFDKVQRAAARFIHQDYRTHRPQH